MLNIDLTGKTALVLGGSRGIGASITEMLCQAGAATVFTHTGNPKYAERINSLVAGIEEEGGQVESVVCDALDSAQTTAMINEIAKQHGRIDILVANVGQNLAGPAEDVSDQQGHRFVDMNLTTAFYGIRAALPHMVKAKFGRIILIGSSAVYDGGGGAIDYAAAKAGMSGMMRYLMKNYARKGILSNTVHPCVIDTDLLRERYDTDEKRKPLVAQIPVGRVGIPQDVSALVAFLASPWSDFICGQEILVDGGRTLF